MRQRILEVAEELMPSFDELAATMGLRADQLRTYFTSPFAIYRELTAPAPARPPDGQPARR